MSYNEVNFSADEVSWGYGFAQRLRSMMAEKDMTIKELSRKSGIPQSSIDSFRQGSTIPNYFRMIRLAEALEISIERLTDLRPNADVLYWLDEDELEED